MTLRARIWPGLRARSIWLDVVLAVAGCGLIAIGTLAPRPSSWLWVVVIPGTVVLALLLTVFRRSRPMAPFLLAAALCTLSSSVTFGLAIASYAVGRYIGRWPVRIVAAVIGAVAVSQPWAGGTLSEQASRFATIAPIVLLPGAVGVYVRTRALLLIALRDRAERAEAERELLARDAVLVERTRIAREMHDAVGHRVSLMVLQAGAIEMAAGGRERVEQLAGQVQTAGRQALEELRQMVGVLRGEGVDDDAPLGPQPGLTDLPALVVQAKEAGMSVDLALPPEGLDGADAVTGRAAYRIAQEALTNAGKHAPGAAVRLVVERPAGQVVVRVVNGPSQRPADDPPGGGFGLVGLAERVRTLGGRLTAEPRLDGGFLVEAVLPT
jgi:signal transduction histidine kinase